MRYFELPECVVARSLVQPLAVVAVRRADSAPPRVNRSRCRPDGGSERLSSPRTRTR